MKIRMGPRCEIHPSAVIDVGIGYIGADTIIKAGVVIECDRLELSRQTYIDRNVSIGGGQARDKTSYLAAGPWLHVGEGSHINTGQGVQLGSEVGISRNCQIYTHAAWPNPILTGVIPTYGKVEITDGCWLAASTIVLPGARLTDNYCSKPGEVIGLGAHRQGTPRPLDKATTRILLQRITHSTNAMLPDHASLLCDDESILVVVSVHTTQFHVPTREITGPANLHSITLWNQLRRNGLRFPYRRVESEWVPWKDQVGLYD
jgi:carbonic anhydrase/acetyltransferase-like protein (isoleucine patch superfamily)